MITECAGLGGGERGGEYRVGGLAAIRGDSRHGLVVVWKDAASAQRGCDELTTLRRRAQGCWVLPATGGCGAGGVNDTAAGEWIGRGAAGGRGLPRCCWVQAGGEWWV